MSKPQICNERLCLTADRQALVRYGHRDANTLYATPGTEIPASACERFGLVDGAIPEGEEIAVSKDAPAIDNKEAPQGETKPASTPEDKTVTLGKGGPASDADDTPKSPELTDVEGVGEATAKKLIAGGIAGVVALAATDPEKAPAIEGLHKTFDWAAAVASAKDLTTPDGSIA